MNKQSKIPVYSIDTFKSASARSTYQVEIFDRNRHYKVEYPHRHDFFYEVLYIKQGSGVYHIDFQDYHIKPETIFFVSPGQVHEISFSEDIFGYIFLFTDEFLSVTQDEKYFWLFDKLNYKTDPSHISENSNHQKLEWLFTDAIENYNIQDKYTDNICRNNLSSILLYCTRLYEDENPVLYKKGKGFELVNKFKSLVSTHFAENWSVKEYADQLAITPSHLNETVKKHTGNTASDFIDHKMILEIKRMLVHSDLNVTEIAERFNFIDQSYFSKYFKKRTGTSPKNFKMK